MFLPRARVFIALRCREESPVTMGGGGRGRWHRNRVRHHSLHRVGLHPYHPLFHQHVYPGSPLSSWHCAKQCRTKGKNDSLGLEDLPVSGEGSYRTRPSSFTATGVLLECVQEVVGIRRRGLLILYS